MNGGQINPATQHRCQARQCEQSTLAAESIGAHGSLFNLGKRLPGELPGSTGDLLRPAQNFCWRC
jgi:hypothetical protein